ncbi:MAG: VOC family protein [Candidatus Angelobacter sp.]
MMSSLKMTPLLYTDDVEQSLPFWTEGLGFEKVMEVEEGGKILFALLKKGEQELMLNSRALIQRENPAVAQFTKPHAPVYVDVENLSFVRELAKTHPVVVTEHKTAYGTSEMILREPGGNLVWFASHE